MSSQPVLQQAPVIHIVMYNAGIQPSMVSDDVLYARYITRSLKADVTAAILEHNADIIMLCELGDVAEGLGPTLNTWKESDRVAKLGNIHLVEDMLLELVSHPDVIKSIL